LGVSVYNPGSKGKSLHQTHLKW